jgi:hypothetical protein
MCGEKKCLMQCDLCIYCDKNLSTVPFVTKCLPRFKTRPDPDYKKAEKNVYRKLPTEFEENQPVACMENM